MKMHWKAPTTLIAAYVAGVVFAIGHHFFYRSLNGKHVDSAAFSQQINTGIGTAFAFLVRTCLILAVGVAFTQVLWRDLLRKPIKVSRIDSMTQLLTSFLELLNIKTLQRYPVLAFLAFVSWALPTAIVIPPATLTVLKATDAYRNYTSTHVPTVDYTKTGNFTAIPEDRNSDGMYYGTSTQLAGLALGTAIRGEIASVPSPASDSFYSLRFHGPAIQCLNTSATILNGFESVSQFSEMTYTYLAWVPSFSLRVPFGNQSLDNQLNIDFTPGNVGGPAEGFRDVGGYEEEPASLYIALNVSKEDTMSVLSCSLYNASYDATFTFSNGSQTINATRKLLHGMPLHLGFDLAQGQYELWVPSGLNYQAVMESFGRIVVGSVQYSNAPDATLIPYTNLWNCRNSVSHKFSLSCFGAMAEELFENITLSLFNRPEYTNMDSVAEVTVLTYPNIYLYSWKRLVLAYGLAVIFAGICVLIGYLSMMASGESYSHTFSTIMRTTRQPEIDNYIGDEHRNGADPRPERLGKVKIKIGRTNEIDNQNSVVVNQAAERDSLLESQVLQLNKCDENGQNNMRLSLISIDHGSIHLPFENPDSHVVSHSEDSTSTAVSSLRSLRRSRASSPISTISHRTTNDDENNQAQ